MQPFFGPLSRRYLPFGAYDNGAHVRGIATTRKGRAYNFYDENARAWLAMARDAYAYVQKGFGDAEVRPDDVAKILHPTLAIDPTLDAFLNRKKLKQKYWKRDFTDLVLDRTWSELKKGKKK